MASNVRTAPTFRGIAGAVERAAMDTTVASFGLPSEPMNRGRRDNTLPNTSMARQLMQQTFEMELARVNEARTRAGHAPLIELNAMNAHVAPPFMSELAKAIFDAQRKVAFAGPEAQAIPATPANTIMTGMRVRVRPGLDHRDLGVSMEVMNIEGTVIDYDEDEDDDQGTGWEVEFPRWGSYFFHADSLQVVT